MAFNIMDMIASLTGGQDPNQAVLNANGALPPGGVQQTAVPMPPIPSTPKGATTPVTNPQPQGSSPTVTQSPPDLANMYVALMTKNQNAQSLDSGLTLMAAGLSPNAATRQSLIQGALGGGRGGGMSLSAQDMINFQKQAQAQQDLMVRRSMLAGLAKQYQMTPQQIQYLEASGKLDEVIKHYSTENLAMVTDANGQTHAVAPRSGRVITTIGSEKPEETIEVSDPNTGIKYLANKHTGEKIKDLVGATKQEEGTWVEGPHGKVLRSNRTGEAMGQPAGLPPDKIEVVRPDGSRVIVDKSTMPSGTEIAPPRKVGDEIPAITEELHQINKDRAIRGEDPLTTEQLIKMKQTPATNINVGMDGSVLGKAPEGYEWERDPKTGKVLLDEKGHAKYYKPEHGKPADEAIRLGEEKAEKVKKEASAQRLKMASVSQTVRSAIDAEQILDDPSNRLPVAGLGTSASLQFGGTGAINLKARLGEINAQTAFAQLKAMREASSSGASGLGQVTDFEQRMLSAATGNLDQYQSVDQLRKSLRKVRAAMLVMAENSFDEKDATAYDKALNAKIKEIEEAAGTVKGGKGGRSAVRPR